MNTCVPLVSICIPTYNSASYLRQTLDSLLVQTYANIEIIVSDNASTDETPHILQEYADNHGIRILLNKDNIGAGGNFNRLIGAAHGEYTAIYHADDLYEPTIVEESVRIFTADPSVGLVGTMALAIDRVGKQLFSYTLPEAVAEEAAGTYDFDAVVLGLLKTLGRNIFFITPSIMVRTKLYRELGGFDQATFKSSVDYEMWLRIAAVYPVAIIDKPLMRYRLHDQQGSEQEVRKNVELPDLYPVLQAYKHRISKESVRSACDKALDWIVLKTAFKQNYLGRFEQSSGTAALTRSFSCRSIARLLRIANSVHVNCHVWPGIK